MQQSDLFPRSLPRGLIYEADFLSGEEERQLLGIIGELPLRAAQYRQYTARRRTVNYGSSYDFQQQQATPAPPLPAVLAPLRARVAAWAGVAVDEFVQTLVAEYRPGAPLGWHRDVPEFELVAGVSIGGAGRLRFRPYPWRPERRREMFELDLQPRSIYLIRDDARWAWQHSVPPAKALRCSITFRTSRAAAHRAVSPAGTFSPSKAPL